MLYMETVTVHIRIKYIVWTKCRILTVKLCGTYRVYSVKCIYTSFEKYYIKKRRERIRNEIFRE